MTKHFNITTALPDANRPPLDVSKVEVGSMVYVATNPDTEGDDEGMCIVGRVDGDRLFDTKPIYGGFDRNRIVEHLDGVFCDVNDPDERVVAGHHDKILITLGEEYERLVPQERAGRALVHQLFCQWDKARVGGMTNAEQEALPEYEAYSTAYSQHAATIGNRVYLLGSAIRRCRPSTPQGLVHLLRAEYFDELDDGGLDADGKDETYEAARYRKRLEDAEAIVSKISIRRPTGTLAELIEAHRAAWEAFGAAIDPYNEADDALNALHGNKPITTPAVIRNGKVVASVEVHGEDAEADRAEIKKCHDRLVAELNLRQVNAMAPEAAAIIQRQIDASLAECFRRYDEETTPELAARRLPFAPAMLAYETTNQAERDALDALLRYRPASVIELGILAKYLSDSDLADYRDMERFVENLGALATVDPEDAEAEVQRSVRHFKEASMAFDPTIKGVWVGHDEGGNLNSLVIDRSGKALAKAKKLQGKAA